MKIEIWNLVLYEMMLRSLLGNRVKLVVVIEFVVGLEIWIGECVEDVFFETGRV